MKCFVLFTGALAASFCAGSTNFCIVPGNGTKSGQSCFTVHCAAKGWCGFGIGSQTMAGADIYLGWTNTTGGVQLANVKGLGHDRPLPNSPQNAVLVALLDPKPTWSSISYSFCRNSASPAITAGQRYIYAYSRNAPSGNLNSPSAVFVEHDDYNSFSVDFTSSAGTVATGTSQGDSILQVSPGFTMETISGIHGALMWIAWSLSPFVGIFVARYGKHALGHNWFIIHKWTMGGVTTVFTIISFVLIFLYRRQPHFSSLGGGANDAHVKMGLAVTIGCIVQSILGILSDKWFDPSRTSIPVVDKLHWWLGRSIFLLGLVNVYFGFLAYSNQGYVFQDYIMYLYWVIVGLGFLAFIYAEIRLGSSHHVGEKETAA
ncbi:hypothetical protein HDU91_004473 [Kappamyces sp. JEL0680]|nr:hypothetical protein HDU91_004473 [Kappamyces sp. JEL0680]